jgi:predicted metal-dependent phosphoesterase TrpH
MKKIDLHIHTKFSDGLLSSKEILELAQERKLDVISITDHDTLDGYKIASKIVGDYNLQLIPGVEISSNYHGKEVHILAYNFDPDNKKLLELLKYIQRGRFLRAKKMVWTNRKNLTTL